MNAGLAKLLETMEADLSLPDKELREALYKVNAHRGVVLKDLDFQGFGRRGLVIYRMEGLDKPTEYSWPQFVKMVRQAQRDEMKGDLNMTQSTEQMATFKSAELHNVEVRIAEHFANAARNLVDVGRCLNEAKDRGLVPHGQWETWVEAHTGMHIQKAQRLMRIAREVPEDSAMARLSFTKVVQLLALPEPEKREQLALAAESENLTVKQLEERIKQLQQENQTREADAGKLAAENASLERKAGRQADMLEQMDADRAAMRARIAELEGSLNNLIQTQNEVVNEEVATQVAARVAELQAELAEARDYAAQQAELRQQAVQEMLNASMGQATAAAMQKFGPYELESAVRAFIGEAGVMAHMGAELAQMNDSDRNDMRRCLGRLDDWLRAAHAALDTVVIING